MSSKTLRASGTIAALWLSLGGLAGAPASAQPATPQPRSAGDIRAEEARRAVEEGRIRYFPKKAKDAGVSGRATFDCLVEPDGWLTDCRIVSEEPADYDFGATALAMSPLFKVNPALAGTRAQVPLNFTLPD